MSSFIRLSVLSLFSAAGLLLQSVIPGAAMAQADGVTGVKGPGSGGSGEMTFDVVFNPSSINLQMSAGDTALVSLDIENTFNDPPTDLTWELSLLFEESQALRSAGSGLVETSVAFLPGIHPQGPERVPSYDQQNWTAVSRDGERNTNVLVLADGGTEIAIQSVLDELGDYSATYVMDDGVYDGTNPALDGFDLVIYPDGINLGSNMPQAGQQEIVDFVQSGGGLIVTEWVGYEILNGRLSTLASIIPMTRTSGGTSTLLYTLENSEHPVTQGVANSFNVTSGYSTMLLQSGQALLSAGGTPTVAVDESSGGRVLQFSCSGNYSGYTPFSESNMRQLLANGIVWAAGQGSWLSASQNSGTVTAGTIATIDFLVDTRELNAGDYQATIRISSEVLDGGYTDIPVSLSLDGEPVIAVLPTVLEFPTIFVGDSTKLSVEVFNTGTDTLDISAVQPELAVFSIAEAIFQVLPGESTLMDIVYQPDTAMDHGSLLQIFSNDPLTSVFDVSLVAMALVTPVLELSPGNFEFAALTGQTDSGDLLVDNSAGGSMLTFTAEVVYGNPARVRATQPTDRARENAANHIRVAKGEVDPRRSSYSNRDSGGPDGFGYMWKDSDDSGGPTYVWNDIQGSGDPLGLYADDAYATVELPFDFPFYGIERNSLNISTNGYLVFNNQGSNTSPDPFPDPNDPNDIIAVFWKDQVSYGGEIYTLYDNLAGTLTIQFDALDDYDDSGSYTYQVVLHENGDIFFYYEDMNGYTDDCGIGIEDPNGFDGLEVVFAAPYVHNGLAVHVGFNGLADWLSLDQSSGEVAPGGTLGLSVTAMAQPDMITNTYGASIIVESNALENGTQSIPVSFNVSGLPQIELSVSAVDFGDAFIGQMTTRYILVSNTGTENLNLSATTNTAEFTVDETPFSLPPFASHFLAVDFVSAATGTFDGLLSIEHNDVPDSPSLITLTANAIDLPELEINPGSFDVTLDSGESQVETLSIGNSNGGSTLEFSSEVQNISVSPVSRSRPIGFHANRETLSSHPRRPYPEIPDTPTGSLSDIGDIVNYWGSFPYSNLGIAFADGSLWVLVEGYGGEGEGGPDGATIVRWNLNGGYEEDSFFLETYSPQSMTWDGSNFWVLDWDGIVTGYSVNGVPIGNFDIPEYSWQEAVLAFDGEYFIYADDGESVIKRVDYDGTLIEAITHELPLDIDAGFWVPQHYSGHLWVWDETIDELAQLNIAGGTVEVLATIDIGNPGWIRSLTHDGNNLFVATYGGELWEVEDGIEEVDFFSLDPDAGIVLAGQTLNADLTFNSSPSFAGTVQADLVIFANDPNASETVIPLSLTVVGAPEIVVDQSSLDFGSIYLGGQSTQQLHIANPGSETLEISSVVTGLDDFTPAFTAWTLAPGEGVDLQIDFAPIISGDRSSTLSIISNDQSHPILDVSLLAEGLESPELSVTPESFTEWLAAGSTGDYPLTLSNTGEGVLDYQIEITHAARLAQAQQGRSYEALELAKGEEDPREGMRPQRDAGGPDIFGYSWRDSNDPGGPVYNWVDITSGLGTNQNLNGDDNSVAIDLPFVFPFYGEDKTLVRMSTNGLLSFGTGSNSYSNQPIPTSFNPNDFIAPFWDDLNGNNGDFWFWNDTAQNRAVFTFDNLWHLGGSGYYSFQVILYPSGKILCQYQELTGTLSSHTIGLENALGDDGLQVVYNSEYLQEGMAIVFNDNLDWLTADISSGSIAPNASEQILLSVDATSLLDGAYDAQVVVLNNDPTNSALAVPFHLTIAGFPEITVDLSDIDFGTVFTQSSAMATLGIGNTGTGHLTVSDLQIDHAAFTAESGPLVIAPGATHFLEILFTPDQEGSFNATLTISSDDDDEAQLQVNLLGEGQDPPIMVVTPDSIDETTFSGESISTWLVVDNSTGGSFLEYSIEFMDFTEARNLVQLRRSKTENRAGRDARNAWIDFSVLSGVVEAGGQDSILVTLNSTLDYAGTYGGEIHVMGNDPQNPDEVVSVSLEVTGIAVLALDADSLDFGSVFENTMEQRDFMVENIGSALLTASSLSLVDPAFVVTPQNFSLQPGESLQIVVDFDAQTLGLHNTELLINSNDSEFPQLSLPIFAESIPVPVMVTSPDSLSSSLVSAEVETQALTIDNSAGGSELSFSVDVVEDLARRQNALNKAPRPHNALVDNIPGKNERDTRPGFFGNRSSGGPDAFGYSWKDSDEPNGVIYDWTDIRTTGTQLSLGGDDASTQVTLPFSFPFYGENKSSILVGTNGFITFGNSGNSYGNQFLPSASAPNDLIAAFWDDLHFRSSGRAYTQYDPVFERFIVQYTDIQRYSGAGSYTFQIILYQSGRIKLQYASISGITNSSTVGIENAAGTVGSLVAFNQSYVHEGLAVQYSTSPDWITVLPSSGTVPAGQNMTVDVQFSAIGLLDFDDTALLIVNGNDPANPSEQIPVRFHVDGNPDLLPGIVSNPFPVDGELQIEALPLLSWLPADGAEYYDLYVWPSDSAQPETPLVTITDISYQIVAALDFGVSYNWLVNAGNLYGENNGPTWSFTVRTQPDLMVAEILVPTQTFTEQEYEVSWTITNIGPGGTTVPSWIDRVYISENPVFSWSEVSFLGNFQNVSYLGSGESYLNTQTFTVPQGLTGNFWIHILTDYQNSLAEGDESNNTGSSSTSIEFVLTPPPDLTISTVTAPANGFSGQAFQVNWTVENSGTGDALDSQWFDAVYVSADTVFDASQATYLGRVSRSGGLLSGESYSSNGSFTVPVSSFGSLHFIVVTDYLNQVFEHAWESNNGNTSSTVSVTLAPPADLDVIAFVAPDSAAVLQEIYVSWIVRNSGFDNTAVSSWTDRVYLSDNQLLDAEDLNLGAVSHSGFLAPGEEYSAGRNVVLPDNMTGPFYLLVHADDNDQVFEHIFESNNTSANTLELGQPDLDPVELLVTGAAQSGETLPIEWTVQNTGMAGAHGDWWTDAVYITESEILDLDNLSPIGMFIQQPALLAGDSYTRSEGVLLPEGAEGTWFLHLLSDATNRVYESNEDNNTELNISTVEISLSAWANLQPNTISVLNLDALAVGSTMEILYEAENTGQGELDSLDGWVDEFYLSLFPDFSVGPNIFLGSIDNNGPLAFEDAYTNFNSFTIPTIAAGQYYLHLVIDAGSSVYEHTQEDDNSLVSIPLNISGAQPADLVVTAIAATDSTGSGQAIQLDWTVENQGLGQTSYYWIDALYISEDDELSFSEDILLDNRWNYGALAAGESYSVGRSVIIPDALEGEYTIFVVTDRFSYVPEADENNNSAMQSIMVSLTPAPDLIVTEFGVGAEAIAGQPLDLNTTVLNQGAGSTTGSFFDAIYLSQNSSWDPSDLRLHTYERAGLLAVDSSYTREAVLDLPVYLSAGNYYLIFHTDSDDRQYEQDESNNGASQLVTIVQPDPSDLVVSAIVVPPSATTGEAVSLSWTLSNQGENQATGQMCDAVYFSLDETWDINDALIGLDCRMIDIAPGGRMEVSMDVDISESMRTNEDGEVQDDLPGLSPADYYVIIRTDLRNNIRESDVDNNRSVSSEVVDVDMPVLELGLPEMTTIQDGQALHYRVDVPVGETLRLTVSGPEGTVYSELYTSGDEVPTRSNYDEVGAEPYRLNQVALVPETQAESYFVMVYGNGQINTSVAVEVLAELVEFSIASVSPDHGGHGGQVTMLIEGARFDLASTVSLEDSLGNTAELISSEVMDASHITATFELSADLPLGVYDLIVSNPERVETMLVNGFTVEAPTGASVSFGYTRPGSMRRGGSGLYQFSVVNTSNNDIPFLSAMLAIPEGSSYTVESGRLMTNSEFLSDSLAQLVTGVDHFDEQGWRIIPLVATNVAVGEILDLRLSVSGVQGDSFPLRFFVDGFSREEFVQGQLAYIELLRQSVLEDESGMFAPEFYDLAEFPDDFTDMMLATYVSMGLLTADDISGVTSSMISNAIALVADLPAEIQHMMNRDLTTCQNLLNWLELVGRLGIIGIGVATGSLLAPVTFGLSAALAVGAGIGLGVNIGSMINGSPGLLARILCDDTPVVASRDPNDILGPIGYGDENFIAADQNLPFMIRFENDPEEATAPAQVVTITQTFDEDLDLSTFRLGDFGFGPFTFDVPNNRSFFQSRLDVSDSLGIFVDFTAGLDVVENRAFWILSSVDPATGEAPLDPMSGFLAVNDTTGAGEGFITYSIQPASDAQTGDVIDSEARIVFDDNEAINTPKIFHTVDAMGGSSMVTGFPAVSDSVAFEIFWQGQDDDNGSGVASWDIYRSVNDNDLFELYQVELRDTSTVFVGSFGNTYHFFSIARDNVGNTEPLKSTAEASVEVISGTLPLALEIPAEFIYNEDGSLSEDFTTYVSGGIEANYALAVNAPAELLVDISGLQVDFRSAQDWNGSAEVIFTLTDNGTRESISDTTTVTVLPINDAPEVTTALDSLWIPEDGGDCSVDLSTIFMDVDGDVLTYDVSGNAQLTVVITDGIACITPSADWFGMETLVFSADDGQSRSHLGLSDSRRTQVAGRRIASLRADQGKTPRTGSLRDVTDEDLVVIVTPQNDAPLIDLPAEFSMTEDLPLEIDFSLYISDVDNANLSIQSSGSDHIGVSVAGEIVTLTAATNWFGSESIIFNVDDGVRTISSDTTLVTVVGVNDPPSVVGMPDTLWIAEDSGLSTVDLLTYFSDPDDDDLEFTFSGGGILNVELIGSTLQITPLENLFGTEELVIVADDNVSRSIGPLAQSFKVSESTKESRSRLQHTAKTLGSTRAASKGNVLRDQIAPRNARSLNDERVATSGTLVVIVTPVNDPPTIVADLDTLLLLSGGFDDSIDLSTIFEDVDGDPLSFSVSGNSMITIDIDAFGNVAVTAPANYIGEELVVFTADDGQALTHIGGKGGLATPAKRNVQKSHSTDDRASADEDLLIIVNQGHTADTEELPLVFGLKQNFPNPFNPHTTILFTLEETGPVSLIVYDIQGRKVRELINGPVDRGEHSLVFSGADLPSGVYVYQLNAENRQVTHKMILLK